MHIIFFSIYISIFSWSNFSLKIMVGAVVCESEVSNFRGDVTISPGCVVHPSASIIAKSGPIILGENCLVEEYATIINDQDEDENVPTRIEDHRPSSVLVIGSGNVFEVGCTVKARKIGSANVFEMKSYVSNKVSVGNYCVIGAGCRVIDEQIFSDKTVIYGNQSERRESIEKPGVNENLHICSKDNL